MKRPFQLMVDAGVPWEEPRTRYFGSLDAALAASREYEERWQPFVWITEIRPKGERNISHVANGRRQA